MEEKFLVVLLSEGFTLSTIFVLLSSIDPLVLFIFFLSLPEIEGASKLVPK